MADQSSSLPPHLAPHWSDRLDPRTRPDFCDKQAKKTPETPWHNGATRCSACKKPLEDNPIHVSCKKAAVRLLEAAFVEEASILFESLGATPDSHPIFKHQLVLDTKAGQLLVHITGGVVYMRFVDVERAKKHVDHTFGGNGMNPFSGKWNYGYFDDDVPLSTRLALLRQHLACVLPVT